jgi:Ca2+-binding EF-hand superfamily protein
MMTPFQRKKQIHWFNMLDGNKDGFLERADFEVIGHRLATAMGHESGPIHDQIIAGWVSTWEHMQPDVDQNRDGRASLEEFLNFEDRVIYQVSSEEYTAYIGGNARGMVALADLDQNGTLSQSEWRWQFRGFEIDDSEADESFQHIDTNGDGQITVEELIEAWRQFHFSEDADAPGNWILGKPPA